MTGIGPAELLADDHIFDAIVDIHRERVSSGYHPAELEASLLEVLHALYRLTFMVYAKEGATAPPPLTVRRPGQPVGVKEGDRTDVRRRTVADIIASGGQLRGP
jgi:hypothetical protein